MIKELDNSVSQMALQIFTVFQSSYKVEAELLGVSNFPPLARTSAQIEAAQTRFFGCYIGDELAGVIEVSVFNHVLDIGSLTVAPNYFKQGVAGKLLTFVLSYFRYEKSVVETASKNLPAIRLYQKHGFSEFNRWVPEYGIEKVALSLKAAQS